MYIDIWKKYETALLSFGAFRGSHGWIREVRPLWTPPVFRTLHLCKGNELTWKSELKLLVTLKASKEQKNNRP